MNPKFLDGNTLKMTDNEDERRTEITAKSLAKGNTVPDKIWPMEWLVTSLDPTKNLDKRVLSALITH